MEDPYPDGSGYRGWTDRLAERVAAVHPGLLYANLAVRGKLAGQVRAEQLEPALALEPDLVTLAAGLNDALRKNCSVPAVADELEAMYVAFRERGATVLTYTYPDPTPVNRLAGAAMPRLLALNAEIRERAGRHGVLVADLEHHAVASDPRLWDADRLHGNPEGHARIAAAMAHALGLPGEGEGDGDGDAWDAPLPPLAHVPRHRAAAADAVWAYNHLRPWLVRRLRGQSSGDGVVAKRPQLRPVEPARG